MGQYPCKSILQENIAALQEETWGKLHQDIIDFARQQKIEAGRKVRIDANVVETDIHHPTDPTLLGDGIRGFTRWLAEGKALLSPIPGYRFSDHRRVAKKRVLTILNAQKEKVRRNAYKDLLMYADMVREYALGAIPELNNHQPEHSSELFTGRALAEKLARAVGILGKVIDQTDRQVFKGEK